MMWQTPSVAGVAVAVLCLLSSGPFTARACTMADVPCCMEDGEAFCTGEGIVCVNDNRCQACGGFNEFPCIADGADVCDDGLVEFDTGRCRPCGGLGDLPCPALQTAPGCGSGLALNDMGRCRPCGDQDQLVCVGEDGEPSCNGRTGPVGDRCRACGGVGEFPCDDLEAPCDGSLLPAADDELRCRPCGTRNRLCCEPDSGELPCGSGGAQQCVDGICLRCGILSPDAGCPGTGTDAPEDPVMEPTEPVDEPAVGPTVMPVPEEEPEPVPEEPEEAIAPMPEAPEADEPVMADEPEVDDTMEPAADVPL
eukprot:jgi/Ulvmu1/8815/UM048_0070.1